MWYVLDASKDAKLVYGLKRERTEQQIYSGEELEQLFKVIQGDPSEFGVIMAAFYGLRRSEVVGLKWDAIDFENKKISIQHAPFKLPCAILAKHSRIF